MATSLKVLISGSGIAGSSFASCLLRAYPKANITIVERASALRLTGAAVDVRNSAVDVIKWMGIEPEIRANGTKESGVQLVDANGSPIATFEATGRTDVQTFTSEYEIMRGTLAKVIITPILDKVNVVYSESVEDYQPAADGSGKVAVTFANGKKAETYDLLVAADGFGSRIRGKMLDASPRDQIFDEGVHVCYFTVKEDLLKGSTVAQAYTATKGRCILVRPDPDPAGRSSCLLLNITWKSQIDEKKKLNDAIKQGNDAYKKLIRELYQDAGWIAPQLLDSMDASDDFYCTLFGQVRAPKLQTGSNVVLLGDSGYATPGMGTSLAILGSYILAGELLRHPKEINSALKNYEDLMLPFVKTQQGRFPAMQIFNPQSAWGITIRNTIFRIYTMAKIDKIMVWATAKLGFAEKKLALPDYEWPDQTIY